MKLKLSDSDFGRWGSSNKETGNTQRAITRNLDYQIAEYELPDRESYRVLLCPDQDCPDQDLH